jgi:DNA-binding GntR family transcriptional regulator
VETLQVGAREESTVLTELGGGGRLSDLAYTHILETLLNRKIPTGAFLSQNDLVKLLGIPVSPLRDALRVLDKPSEAA